MNHHLNVIYLDLMFFSQSTHGIRMYWIWNWSRGVFFSRLYFCSQCRSLHLTTFLIAIDHWAFLKRIVVGSPVVFNMPNPSSALLTFLLFVVVSVFLDNLSQSFYKIERSARFDRSCHIVIPPILACLQRLYSLISTIAPYQCSTSMAPNDPPITQSWGN